MLDYEYAYHCYSYHHYWYECHYVFVIFSLVTILVCLNSTSFTEIVVVNNTINTWRLMGLSNHL